MKAFERAVAVIPIVSTPCAADGDTTSYLYISVFRLQSTWIGMNKTGHTSILTSTDFASNLG